MNGVIKQLPGWKHARNRGLGFALLAWCLLGTPWLGTGLLGTLAAQQPEQPAGEQTAATEAEVPRYVSVQRLPNATTLARLSNGLTVIVQENHVAPVATVRCYVKNTGSAFEGKYLGAGLSHVLEHVVAGGTTKNRGEDEIERIIDTFGGATNAYTSTDLTAYFIDCPSKNALQAIELVADSMQHIIFEPSEFAREMEVVNRELEDGEVDRGRMRWQLLSQTVYQESPIRHPVIGYQEVLAQMSNESIQEFYRERYVPNNQVFVVVGDVKTQEVLDKVAQQWAGTPRGLETMVVLPEEPEQLSPRESYREMDGSTYDLVVAWPTVKLSHPDLYALDVASYILTEGESSRLATKLKHEQGIVLDVSSASYTPSFVNGFFAVMANTSPEHWEDARDAMIAEVMRLREEPVREAELNKAKKQKASELVLGHQTVQDAAEAFGRNMLSTGDPLFEEQYVAGIQKVTAEDIQRVARKYFLPERLNTIAITPPGGMPQRSSETQESEETSVQKFVLDNGLRVLIKRAPQQPLVNMQAYVLGGTLVENSKNMGISSLTANMLDQGTQNFSADEIADYFDSIGGQIGMSGGRNTVYGSATVLQEDFEKSLEVFAECFTSPTFPEMRFQRVKQIALGGIARRSANPQSEIFEFFSDALPADSPYHIIQGGKADTVGPMQVADLKAYHEHYFVPNNMVVTVYGDVQPKHALELVKQHFGSMKKAENFQPIDFKRPNALARDITEHKVTQKPTGMVLMGYPSAGIFDEKDYAALTVLDAIMSGYSYPGGWLHNELRGEGLVYYVHAFQISGPAPGYFSILSQTQPESISEVVARIRNNVERAKTGELSEEEFNRAKEMIIALNAQDGTTVSSQAQKAAVNELYGLGYDYDESFDARIEAVTLDAVRAAANKYLQHSVLVTTSPEEVSPVQVKGGASSQ